MIAQGNMFILTAEAYADYDTPYDVFICCSNDKEQLDTICDALNKFCEVHPRCNQDILLIPSEESQLYKLLSTGPSGVMSDRVSARRLYVALSSVCGENHIYINTNTFSVKPIVDI